jgi:CheY-like chemotaxis protein
MNVALKPCVLVMEDNDDVRSLYVAIFEAEGYRVVAAADGVAAMHGLRSSQDRIASMVLDLRRPKLDEPGVLRLKSGDPVLSGIPVIGVSATPDGLQVLPSARVEAVLTKPVFVPERLAHVDRCCGHR